MESGSELERLQRWLQSELAEASILEDSKDRERRQIQIEIAISEVIRYRELVGSMALVSAPFVEREANVRDPSNSDVKPTTKSGECHACGASKSNDIEFCPVCGEF